MGSQPLDDYRDQLEQGLAARRFVSSTEDQVPRRQAFERAHPDITIRDPCAHDGMFTAELENRAVEIRAVTLMLLLDELEDRDRRLRSL